MNSERYPASACQHPQYLRCLCCGVCCSLRALVLCRFLSARLDDAKADLWSAGAVLYELMTAKHPYGGTNQVGIYPHLCTGGALDASISSRSPCGC